MSVAKEQQIRARALMLAGVFIIVYVALGIAVSHRPPSAFDRAYEAFLAHGIWIRVASIFTASCYVQVLVPLGVAGLVLAALNRTWRRPALVAIVLTLAGWVTSDALKNLFGRPRPARWVWIHEASKAYSSGHAMWSVLVYGLWAWYVWSSDLPKAVRSVVATLLVLWALGICWSRLALGAHYPTDVIGGLLLGGIFVSLAVAALGPGALTVGERQSTGGRRR